jgi:hypothetical protein
VSCAVATVVQRLDDERRCSRTVKVRLVIGRSQPIRALPTMCVGVPDDRCGSSGLMLQAKDAEADALRTEGSNAGETNEVTARRQRSCSRTAVLPSARDGRGPDLVQGIRPRETSRHVIRW